MAIRLRRGASGLLVLLALIVGIPSTGHADPLQVRAIVERAAPLALADDAGADAITDRVFAQARQANAVLLGELTALGAAAVADITPYLMDARREVRVLAVEALARLGSAEAVDPLMAAVNHPDPVTAGAAALAVAPLGGSRVAGTLRMLVKRTSPAPAHPVLRRQAIRALPATGDVGTLPFLLPLVDALPGPEDTSAVVAALAAVGDPSSLDKVSPLLDVPERRVAALMSLGRYGVHAVPLLETDLAARAGDDTARAQVADAALLLGGPGVPLIERLLSEPGKELHLHILDGLATVPDRATVDSLLRGYLRYRDADYVTRAVAQLGDDRDEAALKGLHALLPNKSLAIRVAAAEAIGKIRNETSVKPLTLALTRESGRATPETAELRRRIVWAIGETRSESTVPAVIGALDLEDQRDAAIEALVKIGQPAVRTLVLIIKSGDDDRTPMAIDALMRIGAVPGADLVALLTHPGRKIRELGLALTAAVGDRTAVPALAKMVADPGTPNRHDALRVLALFYTPDERDLFMGVYKSGDTKLRKVVLETFWRHGDAGAGDVMLKIAEDDGEAELRIAALRGAFFLGLPGTKELCRKMLDYERLMVKQAAVDLLGLFGDPHQVPLLASMLRDAPPELLPHLEQALNRLVRFQGMADAKNPDWKDWYSDNEDHFPRTPRKAAEAEQEGGPKPVPLGGGARLHWAVRGDDDEPPIVLIHDGPDGDSHMLSRGLRELEDDFYVYAYDQRGRGQSTGGVDIDTYSFAREARDLEALREHAGLKRVSLVAHGFGCNIAIEYAAAYPERVDRIVLLNAPYPVAETVADLSGQLRRRLAGAALDAVAWLEGRAGFSPAPVFNERWAYYSFPGFFHSPRRADRHMPPRYNAALRSDILKHLGDFNLEDTFVKVTRPVLVVLADSDLYPEDVQKRWGRLLKLVPGGGKLRTVEKAGHFPFVEREDDTIDLVRDFLQGED